MKRVFNGARKSDGTLLYATWPWDRGIGGKVDDSYYQGWRMWKIGSYDGRQPAINVVLGGPAMSVFTDDPKPLHDDYATYLKFLLNYDLDTQSHEIYATNQTYKESAWDVVSARSTDLSAFKAHGGKLIVPQGFSDPIFSINDTVDWWNAVNAKQNGRAADFVRVYAVPGMNHCNGGPATGSVRQPGRRGRLGRVRRRPRPHPRHRRAQYPVARPDPPALPLSADRALSRLWQSGGLLEFRLRMSGICA